MKLLIADKNIPLVEELFSQQFKVQLLPFEKITTENIKHADILLIRSSSKISEALLRDTQVELIATPTSGVDHLNTRLLSQKGITWFNAPACNADAVVDYVLACVARLQTNRHLPEQKLKAGIIGVGAVGSRVAKSFERLGFEVVLCDPPRSESEKDFQSTDVKNFKELDLISCHTPLTNTGSHPTYQMLNKEFFEKQKSGTVLLNAGRGDVINQNDLFKYGGHLKYCLDVWPHEPNVDADLVKLCLIATPHIAGHTIEARTNAVHVVFKQICQHYEVSAPAEFNTSSPDTNQFAYESWQQLVLDYCDIDSISRNFKSLTLNSIVASGGFKKARDEYVARQQIPRKLLERLLSP